MEEDSAVDSLVGALLLLCRSVPDEPQSPPLELIGVIGCQDGGILHRNRLANRLVCVFDVFSVGIVQAILYQADCQVGYVDPDPRAVEPLRYGNSRAATTERVENQIAFFAASLDDAFKESFGFLSGVAEAFLCIRGDRRNVIPKILNFYSW